MADALKAIKNCVESFAGAEYGVCRLDWGDYAEQGFNYALVIYHPYGYLTDPSDPYDEELQHQEEMRGREKTARISEKLEEEFSKEGIPHQIPKGGPCTMKPPFKAYLSNKYIGVRSGIGWIGRNDLLITKKYGSHIFTLGAVFYAEDFPVSEPEVLDGCEGCSRCVEACPYRNIKGPRWSEVRSRDELVDYEKCSDIRFKISEKRNLDHKWTCAKCLLACPVGIENIKRFIEDKADEGHTS